MVKWSAANSNHGGAGRSRVVGRRAGAAPTVCGSTAARRNARRLELTLRSALQVRGFPLALSGIHPIQRVRPLDMLNGDGSAVMRV